MSARDFRDHITLYLHLIHRTMKKYVYIRQCVQSRSTLGVSLSIFYKRISETRQFVKNVGLFWLTVLEVGKSKIMATFLRGL
jgi:hypothetical protein